MNYVYFHVLQFRQLPVTSRHAHVGYHLQAVFSDAPHTLVCRELNSTFIDLTALKLY